MDRNERRELEIARGREMGERASRIDTILRWVSAKKVAMTEALPGHKLYDPACRVEIAYVNKVAAASAYIDQNYPTEQYVAAIGLAISIMVGFDGVAPANPPDRQIGRAHV